MPNLASDRLVRPNPAMAIGSILEAESYFKSPDYQDSYYFPYNPDPHCRGNNYDTYEEMRDDDQIKVAVSFKKDVLMNSGWQIECDYPEVKQFLEESIKSMQEDGSLQMSFEDAIRDMLSAYEFGFSVAEPIFKIKEGMYQFDSIRVRPQQTFRFDITDKGDVTALLQNTNSGEVAFDPRIFLHHVYQSEWGNPYGKSDLRAAHNSWKAKKFVTKFLAIYLERFATPTVIGRLSDTSDTNELARLSTVLRSIQNATTLVLPESAMVEFVQANKDSTDVYINALNYYNMHIARALLVPDLMGISGEKTSGGSFALGQDQFKLFLATIDKDRLSLARKITLRLIKPLVAANFGPGVKSEFKFVPYSMDDHMELLKIWADVAKGKLFKPNPEEINHLRKQVKFPEGPVEFEVPVLPGMLPGMPLPQAPAGEVPLLPAPWDAEPAAPSELMEPLSEAGLAEVSSFKAKRAFTSAEKKVDFAQISKSLDGAENELARRLKRAGKAIWQDYVKQIRDSGLITRFDPKRLNDLKPRFLRDFNIVLKNSFVDLAEKAYDEARKELFPGKKFGLEEGELEIEDMMEVLEAEAFNVTKDYSGLVNKKVNNAISRGLKQSMSPDEIFAIIRRELPDDTDSWIDTLFRTKTTEIYNRGRKSYFDNDDDAKSVIAGYQFSAIIDSRTTEICSSLDKKVFEVGDGNINLIVPPLHWNCRSIAVPVTRFEKEAMAEAESVPDRDELVDMGANLLSEKTDIVHKTES